MDDSRIKRHNKRYQYILSKKNVPCMDCGNTFPGCCMDFHHISEDKDPVLKRNGRGKSMGVIMKKWSIKKIDEEISKCVVICSNCHRIRHHRKDDF
jgi:hypothetical protein